MPDPADPVPVVVELAPAAPPVFGRLPPADVELPVDVDGPLVVGPEAPVLDPVSPVLEVELPAEPVVVGADAVLRCGAAVR